MATKLGRQGGDLGTEMDLQTSIFTESYLKDLVNIASPTRLQDGVEKAMQFTTECMTRLGLSVERVAPQREFQTHISTELLHAYCGPSHGPQIGFIGHLDTVASPDSNYFYQRGSERITGAGIADDKASVFVGLVAVERFLRKFPKPPFGIHIYLSPNEETGSNGFHHYFGEEGKRLDFVFGLEPALNDGSIISKRNGNRWYDVILKAKRGHSGRAPKGIQNAAHCLSVKLAHVVHQTLDMKESTLNVTMLKGGSEHYNTLCDWAHARLDARFESFQGRQNIHDLVTYACNHIGLKCSQGDGISQCDFTIADDCPPLARTPQSTAVARKYLDLLEQHCTRINGHGHSGGAADVNHFCNERNICLDGLGAVGDGLHTKKEFVWTDSILSRSSTLFDLLIWISNHALRPKEWNHGTGSFADQDRQVDR